MKVKVLISLVVLIALGVGTYFFLNKGEKVSYSYTPYVVKKGTLKESIDATGMVNPQNRLEIKSPIAGRIEEILVREGDEVKRGTILAWSSSTERAALLDSVRTQGAEELKRWEDLYRPTPIMAPIDGTIILRGMETGQSFSSTDPLFTMADRLIVKANVDETDIAQVSKGQRAIIVLDAYPQNQIAGEVVHLAYDSTTTNNVTSYEVDILTDEIPSFMRSGMTANVTIIVSSLDDIITIPMSAVTMENGESFVFIESKGRYLPQKVTLGENNGRDTEVKEGLEVGQTIYLRSISLPGKELSGSPFMPSRGRRR